MERTMNGYASRKFIVTLTGMGLATLMAYFGKMDGNLMAVLTAGIAAYNWANVQVNARNP